MKQIITTLALILIATATSFAQSCNDDPLYSGFPRRQKMQKLPRDQRALYFNPRLLVSGTATIGAGVAAISIGNAVIQNKLAGETDAKTIEKLAKTQKILNYAGGGVSIVGAIISLCSLSRYDDANKSIRLSRRLSLRDKNGALALSYRF